MRLMAFPRRRKWLAPDFGKKSVVYLGRASLLWQMSLRLSEVGSAGGKGTTGSPREFALAFAEIKTAKSVDAMLHESAKDAEQVTSHGGAGESQDQGAHPKSPEASSQNHDCAAVKLEAG